MCALKKDSISHSETGRRRNRMFILSGDMRKEHISVRWKETKCAAQKMRRAFFRKRKKNDCPQSKFGSAAAGGESVVGSSR